MLILKKLLSQKKHNMSQSSLLIFFCTFFIWWLLHIVIERYFNLSPIILPKKVIQQKDNELKLRFNNSSNIYMRTSKSIDEDGEYRIQQKASLHYIKCIVSLVLVAIAISPFFNELPFESYKRLFIELDASAIQLPFVQAAAAIMLSWYLFETVMLSQYYKIQWSVILHHWLTSMAALLILLGYFKPAALVYGFFMVAMVFPVSFIVAFRTHFGVRFPNAVQKTHKAVSNYYVFLLILCLFFEGLLLWNGIQKGVHDALYIGAIILSCIAWCYDDLKLSKSLKEASTRNYKDLDFAELKQEHINSTF